MSIVGGMIGPGGAPTRATTLPDDGAARKTYPVASGVMDYFPDALVAVANVSYRGNEQHNPGQPLHWARGKSTDEADTMLRHFLQRGTVDVDGVRHSAKMVWRALAILQKEIEAEQAVVVVPTKATTAFGMVKCPQDNSACYSCDPAGVAECQVLADQRAARKEGLVR